MTDLERAQAIVDELGWAANAGRRSLAILAQALAAARREGYEEAAKQTDAVIQGFAHRWMETGAEEMRERAAQTARNAWIASREYIADAIRALPLTPE